MKSDMLKLKDLNFFYFIGLMASDGYLQSTKPMIHISLSNKDESSVNLLNHIKNNYAGNIYNYRTECRWGIYSEEIYNFFKEIGFTVNKTKTLNISDWFSTLNDEQKWAFLTGEIDGDGSFHHKERKLNVWRSQIKFVTCSETFAYMCYDFLYENCNKIKINKYSTKNKTKVYVIAANEGNTLKCFPRLYECEWGLRRKKEKYFEIINFYKNKKPYKQSRQHIEKRIKNALETKKLKKC